ncbi:MAG: MmcB family DNA repair protein [Pseudomonadota bacterium]|nr:MmcB family DNA repair protein [Pseudomonadota bacterium]
MTGNIKDLKHIEYELEQVLMVDKHNWIKVAKLLYEIEAKELYKLCASSFTQYVNELSRRFRVHVSTIWRAKAAGESYSKLYGKNINEISSDEVNTTPEQLDILRKVQKIAPKKVVDQLEQKIISGENVRQALKNTWNVYKPLKGGKTERGRKPKKSNSNQMLKTKDDIDSPVESSLMTATNIINSLSYELNWIEDAVGTTCTDFQLFKEIAVYTGTTRYSRRIDAVILAMYQFEIKIIGIEIKVNSHDLESDKKMMEYLSYCDYFFVAIPSTLIQVALNVLPKDMGIVVILDEFSEEGFYYKAILQRKSKKLNPPDTCIKEIQSQLLMKILGWK